MNLKNMKKPKLLFPQPNIFLRMIKINCVSYCFQKCTQYEIHSLILASKFFSFHISSIFSIFCMIPQNIVLKKIVIIWRDFINYRRLVLYVFQILSEKLWVLKTISLKLIINTNLIKTNHRIFIFNAVNLNVMVTILMHTLKDSLGVNLDWPILKFHVHRAGHCISTVSDSYLFTIYDF